MRNPWTVGILLAVLNATSALGAEWQEASKTESAATSLDKQSLKRLDGSKVRVDIMMKYAQPQAQAGEEVVIPEHDTSIGNYVVNCADYTSTNQRNAWYLNSKLVKEFNACSLTGR